jgi:hypothetical protein
MSGEQSRLDFVKNKLPLLIIERNEDFKNCSIVKCDAKSNKQLDGFMAEIFSVELTLRDDKTGR